MSEPDKFGLVEPFETENGALDCVSAAYAFALGVEWEMFRQRLNSGKPFTTLCLPPNTKRLVRMCERHRRFVEERPNLSPGWDEIYVGDYLV